MNKETAIKPAANLSGALVRALAEIQGVTKDKVNPHFKSKYADLASVLDTVRPVFAKHDMAVTQETSPSEDGVIVETVVLHASGEERRFGKLYVPANKRDAQGAGSALTYARRYSLMTAFGVPAEDDDGNAAVKAANDRPTTGETPPQKRVELTGGPYRSKTALWKAVREFDRTLRGMGDLAEFEAFLQTEEVVTLLDQCQVDAPQLLDTGEGLPEEYEPLLSLIGRLRKELETADESWRTNPVRAG